MNQRQKLIQTRFLNNEEAILKRLQQVYGQSQKDINSKIANLQFSIGKLQAEYDWLDDNDPEKAKVKSMIQSKIYQKQYQEALKGQVDTILDDLQTKAYTNISDYLKECYDDGFVGTMFDLQGQGIPLCMPLDQEAVVRAVQLDSKISNGLYSRMGEDVSMLKKHITAQVSRGISSGMSFEQVAQQIQFKMTGTYDSPGGALARAMTIARTEGHRIQVQAGMDACERAKEKGADVLKQWDSTMDSSTRESHTKVDGEIRELDKPFSNGLMFPGDPSGGAAEVVNCRCALLQRAKWALDKDELEVLKERASFFGLDKAETFEEYKKKYLKATEKMNADVLKQFGKLGSSACDSIEELKQYMAEKYGVTLSKKAMALDFETVRDATSGIEWTINQFPEIQGYLTKLDSNKLGGVMNTTKLGKTISFSPHTFTGNYYKGNHEFFISTGVHESGHMVEGFLLHLKNMSEADIVDNWNSHKTAKELLNEAMSNLSGTDWAKGKSKIDMYETVTIHSTSSGEVFAEAFKDVYLNGEKASPLSKELMKIIKIKLKK